MASPPATALFNQIRHPQKRAFLLAYAENLSVTESTKHAGVVRQMHWHWMKTDPDYAAAFETAKELGAQALEEEAVRRAQRGVQRAIYYKDQQIGEETVYSDTLLIFLLKGAYPEKYRERFEVHQRTLIDLLIKMQRPEQFSDADLEALLTEAQDLAGQITP